jgi:hypothetical protein
MATSTSVATRRAGTVAHATVILARHVVERATTRVDVMSPIPRPRLVVLRVIVLPVVPLQQAAWLRESGIATTCDGHPSGPTEAMENWVMATRGGTRGIWQPVGRGAQPAVRLRQPIIVVIQMN